MVEVRFDIPDDLHHKLKVKAASEGKTLKQLAIELFGKGVK